MAPKRLGFDAIRLAYNSTGLGNYSRFIVRALFNFDANQSLFLYAPGQSAFTNDFAALGERIQVRTPARLAAGFWAKNIWRRYGLEAACQNDNIEIFHGLAAELPLFRQGRRPATVVSFHDLIYLRYPAFFSPIDRQFYDWRYRFAATSADALIAVSQQTKNDLCHFYGVAPEKIHVIGQGCDPIFYSQQQATEIQAKCVDYGLTQPFLLFVGNAEPRKNIELCLHGLAASQAAKHCLLVVVSRPTRHMQKLKLLAQRLGILDRLRFLSAVPTRDLPALYQAAQVFVYPSIFEGFGIPVLEAMASGTPVITSRQSSLPEVGGDAVYYVSNNNIEEMAVALQTLLSDSSQRQTLSSKGRARAQAFLPQMIAKQINDLYRELC